MSKPVLAAIALFYAVGYWNDYFNAILFVSKQELIPFQLFLRDLVIQNITAAKVGVRTGPAVYEQFKMAVIIIGIIPIVMIYPFVQKHFTRGVLLGSVKE
jgi:ABC-type glycerol-3-phosphate transport system permease component